MLFRSTSDRNRLFRLNVPPETATPGADARKTADGAVLQILLHSTFGLFVRAFFTHPPPSIHPPRSIGLPACECPNRFPRTIASSPKNEETPPVDRPPQPRHTLGAGTNNGGQHADLEYGAATVLDAGRTIPSLRTRSPAQQQLPPARNEEKSLRLDVPLETATPRGRCTKNGGPRRTPNRASREPGPLCPPAASPSAPKGSWGFPRFGTASFYPFKIGRAHV